MVAWIQVVSTGLMVISDKIGNSDFDNGRVMAQGTIDMHGRFSLTSTYDLNDFDWLPKEFIITSWQEIAAD